MDIAVCGAQVPFMRGGAELHMENLVAARSKPPDIAPSSFGSRPRGTRGRIFDAALAWRLVPIDADIVIATNFPSYFVRHDRKVVWLFHQHRAAYDARRAAVERLHVRGRGARGAAHAHRMGQPRARRSEPTLHDLTRGGAPARALQRARCRPAVPPAAAARSRSIAGRSATTSSARPASRATSARS